MLVVGGVILAVSGDALVSESDAHAQAVVDQQRTVLDLQLGAAENLLANVVSVEDITTALQSGDQDNSTFNRLAIQARIGYILNNYLNLDGLVSIDIVTLDGAYYHVGETLAADELNQRAYEQLLAAALASDRSAIWPGVVPNINPASDHALVVPVVRLISSVNPETLVSEPQALVIVSLDVDTFARRLATIDLGEGGFMLLVDDEGTLIYHPNAALIGEPINPVLRAQLQGQAGQFRQRIDGQPYTVTFASADRAGWLIVSLVPLTTQLGPLWALTIASVLVFVAGVTVVVLSSMSVNEHVVQPISTIARRFQAFVDGDETELIEPVESASSGEVAELVRGYNSLVDSLHAREAQQRELQASEERYALVMQAARDGLWDWDLPSGEVYYAPRWWQIVGVDIPPPDNHVNDWLARVHPDDIHELQHDLDAMADGALARIVREHRIRHTDGSYRWVEVHGLALRDGQQRPYRIVGCHTDIHARKLAESQLQREAFYDRLTGLPNQQLFADRLGRAIARQQQHSDSRFAVLLLDLDEFRRVNDSLGHDVGDRLLRQCAIRLANLVPRPVDTLARTGGDEFAFLLEDLDNPREVRQFADSIRERLTVPFDLEGHDLVISASIGIVVSGGIQTAVPEYLRDAEVAMYRAKAAGRGNYEIFDALMRLDVVARLGLEADLRTAVERHELQVYFQPIFSLTDNTIVGFEALLRWPHPRQGLIAPLDFIAIAEDLDLMPAIGHWVVYEACRQTSLWNRHLTLDCPLHVSVNMTASQLMHPDLPDLIVDVLADTDLPANLLKIEVTERTVIDDLDSAIARINQLKEIGVQIQMDDFGTGFSSLSMLYQLPIDLIKLDRAFVDQMHRDPTQANIVRAIVSIAHEMGLPLVSEGIENREQLDLLASLGCEYGQGYLLAEPLPARDVPALLTAYRPGEFAAVRPSASAG